MGGHKLSETSVRNYHHSLRTPEDGSDKLSETSVRNYHRSLRNNPEDGSDKLSETSVRNYHRSLHNNPEDGGDKLSETSVRNYSHSLHNNPYLFLSAVYFNSALSTWRNTSTAQLAARYSFIPQVTNHSAGASGLCTAHVDVAAEWTLKLSQFPDRWTKYAPNAASRHSDERVKKSGGASSERRHQRVTTEVLSSDAEGGCQKHPSASVTNTTRDLQHHTQYTNISSLGISIFQSIGPPVTGT